MNRRGFIALFGGVAATWPLAAQAQPSAKRPTLGLLIPGSPASYGQRVAALVQRLRELGWVDGRTIVIEYRWAATQHFDEIAAEFVRSKVDVIFTSGTPPTVAAKRATSEIPIVFAPAGDPLASGLVASHHGLVQPDRRYRRKAGRAVARACGPASPAGDHG